MAGYRNMLPLAGSRWPVAIMVAVLLLAGCKRSATPQSKASSRSTTTAIPANPALGNFEGRWGQDGEVLVTVKRRSDGSGLLTVRHPDPAWRVEVYSARVEDGLLLYEQQNYNDDHPDRPFHKVPCRMSLEPVPGTSNQIKQMLSTKVLQTDLVILERIP